MFPLGTVLMPSVVLPLHVFEERYREMIRWCLDNEPEFGVALIERGSEVGGGDVRTQVGCVARIVEAAEMPDGRYALIAVGTERIRVRRWLDDDPYPVAEVGAWPDPAPGADHGERLAEVVALLRRVLALHAEMADDVTDATVELSDDPVLATWQACAVAPLGPSDRHTLLGLDGPDDRVAALDVLLRDEMDTLERRLALED
jgi:Lon protease-like protein